MRSSSTRSTCTSPVPPDAFAMTTSSRVPSREKETKKRKEAFPHRLPADVMRDAPFSPPTAFSNLLPSTRLSSRRRDKPPPLATIRIHAVLLGCACSRTRVTPRVCHGGPLGGLYDTKGRRKNPNVLIRHTDKSQSFQPFSLRITGEERPVGLPRGQGDDVVLHPSTALPRSTWLAGD